MAMMSEVVGAPADAARAGAPGVARIVGGAGTHVLRWGLVGILAWIGGFKFTHAEAVAIQPLLSHSPFLSWLYGVASVDAVSRLIGASELAIAALIALRPLAPRLSALGSLLAVGVFLTTLSFLVTTPGTVGPVEGYLAPTAVGAFLVKDVALLGAALVTAAEALAAPRR